MDKVSRETLVTAGLQVDQCMDRFMGNEGLMLRLLKKFLDDKTYPALVQAAKSGDMEGMLRAAHTMKGVCGNLSMDALAAVCARQVELLRAGDPSGALALMDQVSAEYDRIVNAIRAVCG